VGQAPIKRNPISSAALKGYILEEVVAFLISNAGYRLLTRKKDDEVDLDWSSNGLQVRGRGGCHQADVLGELAWAPAFSNPIRLFIEAKWKTAERVSIHEIRHAVGILQDINQSLSTVPRRNVTFTNERYTEEVALYGRGFCYSYRYAICSTSGFSENAQAYALAHQIALIDLSLDQFEPLRNAIDELANSILDQYIKDRIQAIGETTRRPRFVQQVRSHIRHEFWEELGGDIEIEQLSSSYDRFFDDLFHVVGEIGELFVGVSATGFLLFLKADDHNLMLRHMNASLDPIVEIHWGLDRPDDWQITVRQKDEMADQELPVCKLTFHLPEVLIKALQARGEQGRPAVALNIKGQHFSRITVIRMTSRKTLFCTLNLDLLSLESARRDLERRRTRGRRRS
jgi:hypothetical protein